MIKQELLLGSLQSRNPKRLHFLHRISIQGRWRRSAALLQYCIWIRWTAKRSVCWQFPGKLAVVGVTWRRPLRLSWYLQVLAPIQLIPCSGAAPWILRVARPRVDTLVIAASLELAFTYLASSSLLANTSASLSLAQPRQSWLNSAYPRVYGGWHQKSRIHANGSRGAFRVV